VGWFCLNCGRGLTGKTKLLCGFAFFKKQHYGFYTCTGKCAARQIQHGMQVAAFNNVLRMATVALSVLLKNVFLITTPALPPAFKF
jgi:hypothetical protein